MKQINTRESNSDFKDVFSRMIEITPISSQDRLLKACWLNTPLGPMLAVSDEKVLHLLEFEDCRGLEREVERLMKRTKSAIALGETQPIQSIKQELTYYFDGKLTEFKTPLSILGSEFQKNVWDALRKIPYGKTCAYAELAMAVGRPSAFRAVAQANGSNQLAIVIPCHRVINLNGALGGYAGGIVRKQWLINHEAGSV